MDGLQVLLGYGYVVVFWVRIRWLVLLVVFSFPYRIRLPGSVSVADQIRCCDVQLRKGIARSFAGTRPVQLFRIENYEPPDGNIIDVCAKRFRCAEVLFQTRLTSTQTETSSMSVSNASVAV